MGTAVIDVKNPVDVRNAALRVLNDALGPEVTQAFIHQQFEGYGNFTEERQAWADEPIEEIARQLKKIDAVVRTHRKNGGAALKNGLPDISFAELTARLKHTN